MLKLHAEGLGVFVEKTTMEKDKVLHPRKCFSAFVKNDITRIDENIFKCVRDIDCDGELYEANYNKTMDINMKKVAFQYHPHKENLQLSAETNPSTGKKYTPYIEIFNRRLHNYNNN